MTDHPYFPIRGLSLAEWQAALRAVEAVLPQIDNRLMSARVLKDGSIEIKTGEVVGGLDGRGHRLCLRKGDRGWQVVDVAQWAS